MTATDHTAQATMWLKLLREGTRVHENAIVQIGYNLRQAGLTLADIGTSEVEIEQLRVNCHKKIAAELLGKVRQSTYFSREERDRRNPTVGRIRADLTLYSWIEEELVQGGLTLRDIGSSGAELVGLLQRDETALARMQSLAG